MKKISIIIGISYFILNAQIERWVYTYNGPANDWDEAYEMVYGNDGNLYVAGYIYENQTNREDFAVISLTTNGIQRWRYTYNGPGNSFDYAEGITYGSDGNLYIVGYTSGSGTSADFTIISLTPSGQQRWIYTYNEPNSYGAYGRKIVYGNDGNLYAAGFTSTTTRGWDLLVISLKTDGTQRWIYRYSGPQDDRPYSLVYGEDGNIYIVGETEDSTGSEMYDFLIISLDTLGQERWVYKYNGPGNGDDRGYAITYGLDRNIYATGQSSGGGTAYDFTIISLTSDGVERWVYRYTTPYALDDIGECITYGLDGNIYAGGTVGLEGYPVVISDFAVLSVDTNGNFRWLNRYCIGVYYHFARSIIYGTNHKIYATGTLAGPQYLETILGVICYTPSGERKWVYTYNGSGYFDGGRSIIYGNDGYLYVAGATTTTGMIDYDWLVISLEDTSQTYIEETTKRELPQIFIPSQIFTNKIILNLTSPSPFLKLTLYNPTGISLFEKLIHLSPDSKYLVIKDEKISTLPKGMYFLKIFSEKGLTKFKLIKF